MKEILGITYMSSKEAASRYGYSDSWFKKRRMEGSSPKFIKFQNKGKILYPLDETDKWFKENAIESE